jgi:hypothetical protein
MEGLSQVIQWFSNLGHVKLKDRSSEEGIEEDALTGAIQLIYKLAHTEVVHA